jgi:hypothetical protein
MNPVDCHIGHYIEMKCAVMDISQSELARHLGW